MGALGVVAATSGLVSAGQIGNGVLKPVRFALLGDWGSGDEGEMAIAERMFAAHQAKPLDLIVGAGDNIYPNGSADLFAPNFERPFAELIKQRVPFHTCFGNHDVRSGADAQLRYPLFNMGGQRFRSVPFGGGMVEFFMLDSNDMDSRQVSWLDTSLQKSTAIWKIPVFHHPIYSSGRAHGSDTGLRKVLEPIFVRNGVQVAFSGHDHIYQRVTPQQGVQYFVSGAGGKIREGDIKRDSLVAFGYDQDSHFLVM
jgi:3',5'-cyclic AMP phosphodiesterase CpdA